MTTFAQIAATMKDEETEKLHDSIKTFIKETQTGIAERKKWINAREEQIKALEGLLKNVETDFDAKTLTLSTMTKYIREAREVLNSGVNTKPKSRRPYDGDDDEDEDC